MSKLYATLSNSAGKEVSLSNNERIEATVYEGNKKQYSVYIEWGDIGDIEKPTMGSIVTVKEWRNEPDERRTRKNECPNGGLHRWHKPYANGETLKCVMCDRVKE